jgi:hypothetical protein
MKLIWLAEDEDIYYAIIDLGDREITMKQIVPPKQSKSKHPGFIDWNAKPGELPEGWVEVDNTSLSTIKPYATGICSKCGEHVAPGFGIYEGDPCPLCKESFHSLPRKEITKWKENEDGVRIPDPPTKNCINASCEYHAENTGFWCTLPECKTGRRL